MLFSFDSSKFLGMWWLDYVLSLYSYFWGIAILSSIVAGPPLMLTNNGLGYLFFPSPHQHLLFVYFCMWAIVNGLRWNFIVVLICISLIASNLEHYFKCQLANCISLLEKCLFRSFPILFLEWCFLLLLLL